MSEPEKNTAEPDYSTKCCNCEATPTVVIVSQTGDVVHATEMCGVCTWGSAKYLDPSDW